MKEIKEIVSRDIFKDFNIPKEFGDEFEMTLTPIKMLKGNNDNLDKHQEENGFSKNILAQKSEDVWNDI